MDRVSDYRLRLFLSVDLAGSTAYKNGQGSSAVGTDPFPAWIGQIRRFYRDFPSNLKQRYQAEAVNEQIEILLEAYPKVWKTIGDEIIFCCRVKSCDHLGVLVAAFIRTLKDYSSTLEALQVRMDVKGAGWLAAFPVPNATITKKELHRSAYLGEEIEELADSRPGDFDFLGSGMDSGFRVARFADVDRFAVSVELAWLLAKSAEQQVFTGVFAYHGRHTLKGVLFERPYPIITLDSERLPSRKKVRDRELELVGGGKPTADKVLQFLEAFMDNEMIERPAIQMRHAIVESILPPKAYVAYAEKAKLVLQELKQRETIEQASNSQEGDSGDVPPEVAAELYEPFTKPSR